MSTIDKRPHADIALDFPIDIGGVQVPALRMRRATAGDELLFSEAKGSDERKTLTLFANLCEIAFADVLKLDAVDLQKLVDQLGKFKGRIPTGSDAP